MFETQLSLFGPDSKPCHTCHHSNCTHACTRLRDWEREKPKTYKLGDMVEYRDPILKKISTATIKHIADLNNVTIYTLSDHAYITRHDIIKTVHQE